MKRALARFRAQQYHNCFETSPRKDGTVHNINNANHLGEFPGLQWTRKDSEELVVLYLNDYYRTLDEYYLREALQIAKDDGVDFDKVMRKVRFQLS